MDDVVGYPTAVITRIWNDIQQSSPRPDFAISPGEYSFSSVARAATASSAAIAGTVNPQLDLYLAARGQFTAPVYFAMSNHECTGYTSSNCGPGNQDGYTSLFSAFLTRMVQPLGVNTPYYEVKFFAQDGSWTAKIVLVAANAWDATQATWLDRVLADPTTYTFIVRNESAAATAAPGVIPSEAIINKYPFTLKIDGFAHAYLRNSSLKEVTCGNGGAPLTTGDYGFAILERLASGVLQFTEYDWQSLAIVDRFRLYANGSPAP